MTPDALDCVRELWGAAIDAEAPKQDNSQFITMALSMLRDSIVRDSKEIGKRLDDLNARADKLEKEKA